MTPEERQAAAKRADVRYNSSPKGKIRNARRNRTAHRRFTQMHHNRLRRYNQMMERAERFPWLADRRPRGVDLFMRATGQKVGDREGPVISARGSHEN